MDKYKAYIYLAFAIKIAFIITAVAALLIKEKNKLKGSSNANIALENKLEYWKDRLDFVFTFLMAFLLIYLFNPRSNQSVMILDNETKILLFLFGIILLITAKWKTFFTQSKWFTSIQKVLSKNQ
jgi:hypothetical protein